MPERLEPGLELARVLGDHGVFERAAGLGAQAFQQGRVGAAQLHRGDVRRFARAHVVDHGGLRAARLDAGAHQGVAVAEAAQARLDPLGARLQAVARRGAVAHDRAHGGLELRLELRAAHLEAHARAAHGLEQQAHPRATRVVGRGELDARAPEAVLGEAPAHRLARLVRLLLLVALARSRPHERLERRRGGHVVALDARARDARAWPGMDPEDGVGAARHGPGHRLDQGLEPSAAREREPDVAPGALEPRGPQRLVRPEAGGARGRAG